MGVTVVGGTLFTVCKSSTIERVRLGLSLPAHLTQPGIETPGLPVTWVFSGGYYTLQCRTPKMDVYVTSQFKHVCFLKGVR